MKALIFAAGLGERMRPLTASTPKPLLLAGGKPLIEWHLEKLAAIGIREIVVNTSWLAEKFPRTLGDGSRWGIDLHFIFEGETPLETGGGMWNALPFLRDGEEAFIAVNGDVWTDYDFSLLPDEPTGEAHLVLVDNPPQHPQGDFALHFPLRASRERVAKPGEGQIGEVVDTHPHPSPGPANAQGAAAFGNARASDSQAHPITPPAGEGEQRLTFAGIGMYRPSLFDDWRSVIGNAPGADATPPRFKLAPLLRAAMARDQVTGARHAGVWADVGTPERLAAL